MRAKEFLSQRGIPYVEKDVAHDRQAAMEMIRLSGQQGVPVIAVDGQVVVGFNRPRLEQLLAARAAAPPAPRRGLGALVGDAAGVARRRADIPASGAYIGGVHAGSPAERAGLQAGDVITAVDGQPVGSAAALEQTLRQTPPGHAAVIAYVRAGTAHQVDIAL